MGHGTITAKNGRITVFFLAKISFKKEFYENLRAERVTSSRHIILISSLNPYEDIPIFESNNYRGLKFEEILQSLQKVNAFFFKDLTLNVSNCILGKSLMMAELDKEKYKKTLDH